jgi:phage-related protein
LNPKFEVVFLEQAIEFIESLESKAKQKVIYNIDKARFENDPKLFKKLTTEIWEFRTKYRGIQYRLLAFWDKSGEDETLVISTHGIVKKVDKVPKKEIEKAERIRNEYFEQ